MVFSVLRCEGLHSAVTQGCHLENWGRRLDACYWRLFHRVLGGLYYVLWELRGCVRWLGDVVAVCRLPLMGLVEVRDLCS